MIASRAVGVDLNGERDVLGMWVGDGGEGAKQCMATLAELRNWGVEDVCIVACDGLKGLPQAIAEIWPQATVQLCVVHLVRASLRYASKAHWSPITKALRTVYTAATAEDAQARFAEFEEVWGGRYPAIVRLWRNAWEQFIPFLDFPPELRRLIYTTNAIESLNARFRLATRRRGHFPNDQAAVESALPGHPVPTAQPGERHRPDRRLESVLNTLAIYYGDRVVKAQDMDDVLFSGPG